jgi:hypothetical protein
LAPLQQSNQLVEYIIGWVNATNPNEAIAQGFLTIQEYGEYNLERNTTHVFRAMASYTLALEQYLQEVPGRLNIGMISRIRGSVHQRVLLLPSLYESTKVSSQTPSIDNACATTALIYSIAVLFPVPKRSRPFRILVTRLRALIETEEIDKDPRISDLLLWMLMAGGIAALGTENRAWYVQQLIEYVMRWKIYEWARVEEIVRDFLWLDSACGEGGRKLWSEVLDPEFPYAMLRLEA